MANQANRRNEDGSVMLIAMLVMLLLTLIGLAATNSSVFEIKMAGNQQQLDEEFARAETALNLAVRNFRSLEGAVALLNDTDNPENHTVSGSEDYSYDGVTLAKVETRRIFLPEAPNKIDVEVLSDQANAVPQLSHRFYDGSIDRKRFAITVTAMKIGTLTPSKTWVQKGLALPSEQDRDLF